MASEKRSISLAASTAKRKTLPYVFSGPALIPIRTRTDDQARYVDTRLAVWRWEDGGSPLSLDWNKCELTPALLELAKGFMADALERLAPQTAFRYGRMIQALSGMAWANSLPWSTEQIISTITRWHNGEYLIPLRRFYHWALNQGIFGFSQEQYLALKEIRGTRLPAYQRIYLAQTGMSLDEEARLLARIDDEATQGASWGRRQANIMLHLSFELGPRAIQIHSLDTSDFELVVSVDENRYYTLWLPMAKKIGQRRPERRPRKLSHSLGDKLKCHIEYLNERFNGHALFVDEEGRRLSTTTITSIIKAELTEAGILSPGQVTMLLRHHLGQGLADQGAPLATIAEILGHNSTAAAHAYIAATPNIAQIKAKALGKSAMYKRLMHALLTGDIQPRQASPQERHVRGIVATQYIGDIGACALPAHTACPYNPVYACYTCKKFHPFADGRHEQVRDALEQEAQKFIDAAEAYDGDVTHNRAVTQHELTIQAVKATIARCQSHLQETDHASE